MSLDPVEDVPMYPDEDEEESKDKDKRKKAKPPKQRKLTIKRR